VPPTILAEDVLGGIARGEDVLARKKLKVYDADGKPVDPSSIDWKKTTAEDFPYTLRQDAGPDNALGRVKFMFPNSYDIYLHDTPSQELFASEERTFSPSADHSMTAYSSRFSTRRCTIASRSVNSSSRTSPPT